MKWISSASICGTLLLLISATVMTCWVAHMPALISIIPTYANMVFNTALCFFLAGNALLMADLRPAQKNILYSLTGCMILLIAVPTFLQTLLHLNLGIDQFFMSAWKADHNPYPGRMSGNTNIAFILAGTCFLLLPRMEKKWVASAAQLLMFCVGLLGMTGLIGYVLNIEFLYSWLSYSRMAIHTSAAFITLGLGLFFAWKNSKDYQVYYSHREDKKIFIISLIVLFYMGLLSGLLGFIISANQNQSVVAESMQQLLQDKTNWLKNSMQQAFNEIDSARNNTVIKSILANGNAVDTSELDDFLIDTSFSSIIIRNRQNKVIYSTGNFNLRSQDAIYLPDKKAQSYLFIADDSLILQSDIPLNDGQTYVGNIQLEWKLNSLGMGFLGANQLQANKESYLICALSLTEKFICTPSIKNSFNKAEMMSFSSVDELNKLIHENRQGMLTGTDYLNENVMIYYRPIDFLNVGMIIKKNLSDIYSPLKKQLILVLPFLFLLQFIGAFILYRQVLPLIKDVFLSKEMANDMNARLNAIFNHVDQGIIVSNIHGTIEEFNPKATEIFGYQKDEMVGQNIKCLMPMNYRDKHQAGMNRYAKTNTPHIIGKGAIELPALHKDGHEIPIELSLTDMVLENKRSIIGIMSDITEKKLTEARMKESEAKFRSAFNSTAIGMAIISTRGQFIQVNDAFCQILGYSESELLQADFQSIIISQDLAGAIKKRDALLNDNIKYFQSDERYHHKNGRTVWLQLTYSLIRADNNEPLYFVVQIQDVTEQKKSAEQLAYQAYYDSLTGLANRLQLEHCIKSLINNTKRYHNKFAIFFLDLDHFKAINDQFGHAIGDEVLITVAERLLNAVRKTDTVARLGGDEFVIVVTDVTTSALLSKFADKVIHALADPMKINDKEFYVTTSLGVSVYPLDGKDSQTLIKNADMALYQAKEKGRNSYHFSSPEIG